MLLAATGTAIRGRKERRPSAVVLVTVDTLRADSVSFLGCDGATTPFLDRLARDGTVFTAAYSPSSWTVPSMASLFTGVMPSSHGVVSGKIEQQHARSGAAQVVQRQPALPESFTTLAEAFAQAGYVTIGIPSNLHLAGRLGFGQGFAQYHAEAGFRPADQVNTLVERELREAFGPEWRSVWKQRPVFLWIHYFDPHDPYFARQPGLARQPSAADSAHACPAGLVMEELKRRFPSPDGELAARLGPLYRAEVSYVDEHLRRLDELLGLSSDDVLFVLTADHGEELADHGGLGHGHTLYEELVRVPLLVRWPEELAAGARIDAPVSLLDVYPTLVELAGLCAPRELQGQSLARFRTRDRGSAEALVFELDRPELKASAVREAGWKLIRRELPERRVELFDLLHDPRESRDLAGLRPDVVEHLGRLLARRLDALPGAPPDGREVAVPEGPVLEQLQAFGYAGGDVRR